MTDQTTVFSMDFSENPELTAVMARNAFLSNANEQLREVLTALTKAAELESHYDDVVRVKLGPHIIKARAVLKEVEDEVS